MHTSTLTLLAVVSLACRPLGIRGVRPAPVDSASAVHLAIAAVANIPDTLVDWVVTEYSHSKDGYVIEINPRIKPKYARAHQVGNSPMVSQLLLGDGGGRVHLNNGGKITLIEVH